MRLLGEFIGLYLAAPLIMAMVLPPVLMFPMLFTMTAVGVALLHGTDGFDWRDLACGSRGVDWPLLGAFTLIAAVMTAGLTRLLNPQGFLFLALHNPWFLALILILYPVMSALPQELIFRVLFFRRYGSLQPGPKIGIVLNAALFSLAHLMYWNWTVIAVTFAGGLVCAWIYEIRRNFIEAVLVHAIAGELIFTMGLGSLFYSGNVIRPF
ncbi:MAG: CPBP family intramembrane glutamic endopeptidase [Hyphomicrobiales bacterium]